MCAGVRALTIRYLPPPAHLHQRLAWRSRLGVPLPPGDGLDQGTHPRGQNVTECWDVTAEVRLTQ